MDMFDRLSFVWLLVLCNMDQDSGRYFPGMQEIRRGWLQKGKTMVVVVVDGSGM